MTIYSSLGCILFLLLSFMDFILSNFMILSLWTHIPHISPTFLPHCPCIRSRQKIHLDSYAQGMLLQCESQITCAIGMSPFSYVYGWWYWKSLPLEMALSSHDPGKCPTLSNFCSQEGSIFHFELLKRSANLLCSYRLGRYWTVLMFSPMMCFPTSQSHFGSVLAGSRFFFFYFHVPC